MLLSSVNPVWGMNKAELIDAMASESGLSKADSKRALEGLLDGVTYGLQDYSRNGGAVYIEGFGAFVRTEREVCNAKDNDCNGRFICTTEDGFSCGSVCNGVDPLYIFGGRSSETCGDGIDDDCDLVVEDDDDSLSTLYELEFIADDDFDDELYGKYYFNYWTDVVLQMANELDELSDTSYRIEPVDDAPEGLVKQVKEPAPATTYDGNFMETVVYWMAVMRDALDDDSDGDGIDDFLSKSKVLQDVKTKHKFRGHVTVLKAALTEDPDGGLAREFAKKAGLSDNLTAFVKDFLLAAIDGLENQNDPIAELEPDTELIVRQMAREVARVSIERNVFKQEFG